MNTKEGPSEVIGKHRNRLTCSKNTASNFNSILCYKYPEHRC